MGDEAVVGGGPTGAPAQMNADGGAERRDAASERAKQAAFLAVLCYLLFSFAVPLIRLPHLHGPAMRALVGWSTLATTFVFMLLQLWLPRALVALRMRAANAIASLIVCAIAWRLFYEVMENPHWHRHLLGDAYVTVCVSGMGITLTLGLTCIGTLLSRIIREVNVLLPVAFVAMPIDYIGAMTPTGYTHDMVMHHPNIVRSVSVSVPVFHGVAPIGFIGPGDVLFVAFFLAVVQNLKLNERGTFWWMYVLLTGTMLAVTIFGVNVAALVPMGIAVLVANFRYFRLQRSEVFASIYAAIIVLVIVTAFYVYAHHHFFSPVR